MKTLSEMLNEIELRYKRSLADPYDTVACENSISDVPALVKALRRALEFVYDVNMGCYDAPEKVKAEIAAILNGEKTDLEEKETK